MATPRKAKQIGSAPIEEVEGDEVVHEMSLMTALDAYINEDNAKRPDKAYVIPGRPAMSMIFNLNIDYEDWDAWQRRSAKKNKRSGGEPEINYLNFANIVISNLNVGMTFNGNPALSDNDGEVLTVKHHDLHKMLKVPIGSPQMCIKKLFGNDADILAMMRRVARDAGYALDGEDIEEESPLDD